MVEAHLADILVIIGYFLFIVLLGVYFGRNTSTTNDFFFAGQRFPWWMIAISCVATVVGSYSFIKYSAAGYKYGLSSTMSYLNDWFILPFFVLGWLPVIYFNRIRSIPEYFLRRFDRRTSLVAILIIMVYMIGYVGINFYTLGVALQPVLNINLYFIIIIIAVLGAIYLHAGGQTSVIMTDIVQGIILIAAGGLIFYLGIKKIGSLDSFWSHLPTTHKLPFADFNSPPEFNFVGIFWQDAFASSVAFWFMSQGTIMRFLSARSPNEGKKAMYAIVLILMPLAAFALSNAGWLGTSMVNQGLIKAPNDPKNIFIHVASFLTTPGVFGFVVAALTAALMSTIDTLVNAISAIFVYDIYKPYFKPNSDDKNELKIARVAALCAAALGVALVPLFASYKSIYTAHGVFIASITPPMATVIMLSVFWKRFTSKAAFYTLIIGSGFMVLGAFIPDLIAPFAHGTSAKGGFKFIRALYGLVISGTLAIIFSFLTKQKNDDELNGLVVNSLREAQVQYKGGAINDAPGEKIQLTVKSSSDGVAISTNNLKRLNANEGDLINVHDLRWFRGALRNVQLKCQAGEISDEIIYLPKHCFKPSYLIENSKVIVEKVF